MPLDPELWKRVREIFDRAVELPLDQRDAFLSEAAGGDESIIREVRSLLDHADSTRDPAAVVRGSAAALDAQPEPTRTGKHVGPYRILDRIGTGGMGTVWLAERDDAAFTKKVALKIVRGGLDHPRLVERFRAERQILAGLEHPGIARLLDGGQTDDGLPYVVMEHVSGEPIDRFVQGRSLSIRETLRLFVRVCDSIEYAHQRLVIHRDIKPANILVNDEGEPKLLDFGIAKMLAEDQSPDLTVAGARPMTPIYAAPEQIRGEPVSTATDVYGLGLLLYELLTGEHPFWNEKRSSREVESAVLETDPAAPSAVARRQTGARPASGGIEPDLDNVVLKAMEKDPSRRYPSVAEFAADVQRYLDDQPVHAQQQTLAYRTQKFVRRNLAAVSIAAVVVVALVTATIVSTTLFVRAQLAQQEAEAQREGAEAIGDFLASMLASVNPRVAQGRDVTLLRELLDTTAGRIETEFEGRPEIEASLRLTIGRTYRAIAAYEESESHLRAAVEIRESMSAEPVLVAAARYQLALLLRETARFAAAESLLIPALEFRREAGPPEELLAALAELAYVRQAQSYHDAEPLRREAIDVAQQSMGESSEAYGEAVYELGRHLWFRDDRDSSRHVAGRLLVEAVEILRRVDEPDPLILADALEGASYAYRYFDEPDRAADALFESLDLERTVLAEDHPDIGLTLGEIATHFEEVGDYEQSETYYRDALRIQRRHLGDDHVEVGTMNNDIAGMLRKAGRYSDARPHYEEAIRIYRASLGPDHAWVAIVLGNAARLYEAQGDCLEAREAIAEFERVAAPFWNPEHPRVAAVRSLRGACLLREKRYAEAEDVLLATYAQLDTSPDEPSAATRDVARWLVRLYEESGRPQEAQRYRTAVGSSGG